MDPKIIQYEGNFLNYNPKFFGGGKWKEIRAVLYSDSTLEWYSKKQPKSPKGILILKNIIPFICIGRQISKIPSKHPKLENCWDENLMIAISLDQNAGKVIWFYFETNEKLKTWLNEIIETLPKLNPPPYEEQKDGFDEGLAEPPPYEAEETKESETKPRSATTTSTRTLDGRLSDYGFGSSFWPLAYFGINVTDSNENCHHHHRHHHRWGHHHHHHHHDGTPILLSNTGPSPNSVPPQIGHGTHLNPSLVTSNTGPSLPVPKIGTGASPKIHTSITAPIGSGNKHRFLGGFKHHHHNTASSPSGVKPFHHHHHITPIHHHTTHHFGGGHSHFGGGHHFHFSL